jgi:uncharacterized protein (DUF2141 family)
MNRLVLAGIGAGLFALPAQAANLSVHLEGVRAAGGTLYVTVQTREQFMQDNGTAGTVIAAPREGAHDFSYDVPPGDYAVSVWHDDNGNSRFDMSESQMPLDGWAMTNGETLRGEPTFDQVRTPVGSAPAAVRLTMNYGR